MASRDRPWIMRTSSGRAAPKEANALYRQNLAKGQTGLCIAFDLPTQTGYDPDHPRARGEVGKSGVPIAHLGDMRDLLDGILLDATSTSMTVDATAAWLFALYVALAEERGVDPKTLTGATQNDVVREYLSRGSFVFPAAQSLRLTSDVVAYAVHNVPQWSPIAICSHHLQEAGATPVQELAYALTTAICVLDAVKARLPAGDDLDGVFGRISFFVGAGLRFVEETCKMRAFAELWDELGRARYGVKDEGLRRFRYDVQPRSREATAEQPENDPVRIAIEMLAGVVSKKARARAVQLPASKDPDVALRTQHILAVETDLLDVEDIFEGSRVVEAKVRELRKAAWREVEAVLMTKGGVLGTVESGYIKERLAASNAARQAPETAASPLPNAADPRAEGEAIERVVAWRAGRDTGKVHASRDALKAAAKEGVNVMPASIACAKAGVTTGEWAGTLREAFGE